MSKSDKPATSMKRRDVLKALTGLPVLGIFAQQFLAKRSYQDRKKQQLLEELQLSDEITFTSAQTSSSQKKDLIRLGIIGFGSRGEDLTRAVGFAHPEWIRDLKQASEQNLRNTRLQDWHNQENLHVVINGICDVFDQRAERGMIAAKNDIHNNSNPQPKRYVDYHDLLAAKDIDAVIIATPDHWHAQIAIDAVNSGKHIYVEKCMTRTEEEVYQVEEAVNKSGVVFQLGHQYHQSAAFAKARDIINKNILGKITLIEATTNRNSPHGAWIRHLDDKGNPKPGDQSSIDWNRWLGHRPRVPFSIDRYYNWTKWWDYATGLSGQLLGHEYDSANNLLQLGIPTSCMASGGIYFFKDNRDIPDIFNVVYEFEEKDLTLVYSASLASARSRGRVFMGQDASMELGNTVDLKIDRDSIRFKDKIKSGIIDPAKSLFTFRPGIDGIDAITSATERYYASRGLTYTYRDGRRVDTTYLHLKEWLDCIRDGGVPSVPIDKAVEVTLACHMATKSYREKRRVTWDPVNRRIV